MPPRVSNGPEPGQLLDHGGAHVDFKSAEQVVVVHEIGIEMKQLFKNGQRRAVAEIHDSVP